MRDALANPENAYDVATAANNTVEVTLNNDSDAALELLAALVTAQPQYIGMGIESPLADALKRTAGILRGRKAQIDAAVDGQVNGTYSGAQRSVPRRDPLTLDLDGDGLETVGFNPSRPVYFDHDLNGTVKAPAGSPLTTAFSSSTATATASSTTVQNFSATTPRLPVVVMPPTALALWRRKTPTLTAKWIVRMPASPACACGAI